MAGAARGPGAERPATAQRVRAIPVPSGSGRSRNGGGDGGGSRAAGVRVVASAAMVRSVVASAPSLEDPEWGLSWQGFGGAAAPHSLPREPCDVPALSTSCLRGTWAATPRPGVRGGHPEAWSHAALSRGEGPPTERRELLPVPWALKGSQ